MRLLLFYLYFFFNELLVHISAPNKMFSKGYLLSLNTSEYYYFVMYVFALLETPFMVIFDLWEKFSHFLKFIYFERESKSVCMNWGRAERERGGERENLKQAPCCQCGAQRRAQTHKPQDHDLSQNQESNTQPTEPPRCPPKCTLL